MFVKSGNAAYEMKAAGDAKILDECLQLSVVAGLQHVACDAERDMRKLLRNGGGGADEDVVTFYVADIAYGCDEHFGKIFRWRRGCVPVGKIETVIDGLDASGIDSIDFNAMSADLFGDSEDGVGSAGHEAIGKVMFAGSENPHVSAAPYQLRRRHRFGHKSCP